MGKNKATMIVPLLLCAFFCAFSFGQVQWDGDGGHTGDYSNIPRLEWAGPGEPDTFEEYLQRRGNFPFSVAHAYSVQVQSSGQRAPKILVLVNSGLYAGIQTKLNVYVADLQNDGYSVEVYQTSGGTPADLKAFILSHVTDLKGCVLIGDHPVAWYEIGSSDVFPCDLYYMELDGTWHDHDLDGKWDELTAGSGDEGPEIFIGRIDASMMTGNEADITNDYFDKNHAYRMGTLPLTDFALTYTEDDWAMYMDIRTDIKYAYPNFEDIPAPATEKSDYLNNRVPNPAYEYIQLACHSSAELHAFTRGGNCWNYEIHAAEPHAIFYNLFCCSTLRWTVKDYLGGSYIYDTSNTSLVVIGSTKSGSMLEFYAFYQPFGQYESYGESFRQWFNYLAPYDNDEISWHFGMTIAGDPLLTKKMPALFLSFPSGLPEGYLPPGPETKMTLEIQDGSQAYLPGSGKLHYRFDTSDPYGEVTVTQLGGGLYEAVLPNTKPGDEPEFYFSAQGDGGMTVYSPAAAPAEVYSFEVCFRDVVMEDDFETSTGWTVENSNVDKGAFERGNPQETDAQPEDDHTEGGTLCYVTGRLAGTSVGAHDLDGGPTRIVSPNIDLSAGDADMQFYVWFYHSSYGQQQPLEIHLSNNGGGTWTHAADITHNGGWNLVSCTVSDHVTPTDQVKIRFSANDNPNDDVVEALIDDFAVVRFDYDPSLWADAYSISVAGQAVVDYSLDAGAGNANRTYLLLGTLSGTSPGFSLPGGQVVPLNWDAFLSLILINPNGPVFQSFMGSLDGAGAATAVFDTLGPTPALVGCTAHFAYLLGPPPAWDFVSNPVPLTFDP